MKLNKTFTNILTALEENSTCKKHKVAALIVKDKRIISMGWNGVVEGAKHCTDVFKDYDTFSEEFKEKHREWSKDNELHAELNAIAFAAKEGISTEGAEIYITMPPCSACAHLIIAAGINKVFYKKNHNSSMKSIEKLNRVGIVVNKIQ